ncbi:MAG: FmdB family zinc ribbon protein [Aeromicrobium sp.]
MPTYQYQCTECGEALEVIQSFSDDALTECPECAGRLRKVFNAVGVVFKGSGFYRNDSRPKSTESSTSTDTSKSEPAKNGAAKNGAAKSETSTTTTSTPAPTGG